MVISIIHEHSLDHTNFETKEIRDMEIDCMKDGYINRIAYGDFIKWYGILGIYDMTPKILLHYES